MNAPIHPVPVKRHTEAVVLAVLPFENLSPDNELEVVCKAFCMDLITELSRFRQFQMMAWQSVKHIASGNWDALKPMQIDYFIEGSFRLVHSHIRINAQLVDNRSNRVVWANRFEAENVLVLQD